MRCKFLVVVLVFMLAGCDSELSVEAQIARDLRAMADAGEAGDIGGAARFIGATYRDLRGNDKRAVVNQFRLARLATDNLAIFLDIQSISMITATLAEADVRVRFAGIDTGRLALEGASYRFILEVEQDGSEWAIVAARWARGDGEPR
ncbi:MAG: hypothetical protein AAF004_05260 [Pseudomonadota bacterium]